MKKTPIFFRESLLGTALRTVTTYVPAVCAATITLSPLNAQTVSVNLAANESSGSIDTTAGANPAGAVSIGGEYWNNASGASGTLAAGTVIDETGAVLPGFEVSWTSTGTWRSASPGATATSQNGALTKGYLDDGSGWSVNIATPFLLHDVYVIHATDQGSPAAMSAVSVGGQYYIGDGAGGTIPVAGSGNSWSADNWEDADTLTESDHFLRIQGVPNPSLSALQSSPDRAAIAGFQIVNAYAGALSYWDANGATPGAGDLAGGDLNGTWGSDGFWSTDPTGSSATGAWTPGHAAVFSAGDDGVNNHSITVSGTQTVDSIWVQQGGITLTGGTLDMVGATGILRDDAGGLVIDSALSADDLSILGDVSLNNAANSISGNVAVTGNLTLGADQSFGSLTGNGGVALGGQTLSAGGASDFAFNGTFTGGAGSELEKTGTGTLTLDSLPTAVETLNISDGTLAVPAGTLNSALAGSGTFHKSGSGNFILNSTGNNSFTGRIRVNGSIFRFAADSSLGAAPGGLTADAIILENGARLQGGSSGGGGDVTIDANRGITLNNGNSGFHVWTGFTMTVDAPIANGTVDDGDGGILAATLTKSDGGTLILNGGSTHTGDTRVEAGTMVVNSAITSSNNLRMTGTSVLELGAGADLTTNRLVTSDGGGANSTINQTDGTFNIVGTNNSNNTSASFLMGHWGGGSASVYNLSGGTLNSLGAELSLGWDSNNVNFNQTGGVANLLGIDLANGRSNAASVNLDGGTLNLGANGITNNPNKSVNLGGGTLGSLASWSTSQSLQLTGTNGDSSIAPSAGHVIALNGGLSGSAGFSMDGAGTLELAGAGTFAGNADVNSGTLHLGGSITSGIEVGGGGTLAAGTVATAGSGSMGSLTLADGSSSFFRVGPSGDLLTVTGTDAFTVLAGATHSIDIAPAGQLAVNDEFTLIDYDGSIQGEGFTGLSLNSLPNPHYLASLINDPLNSAVKVKVDSIETVVWTGANSALWDVEATQNFALRSDSSPSLFYTYDVVEFDDSASQFDVTLTGTITPATVSFDHSANDYTLDGSGIGGSGGLTKAGSGTLTLLNTNTYGGDTTVSGGRLVIGDGTSGSISASGSVSIASGAELEWRGGAGASFSNATTNDGTFRVGGTNDVAITTGIGGSGDIVIDNSGTTTLSGSGFTGNLILNGGTTLGTGGSWATSFFGNGTRSITINSGATFEQTAAHDLGGLGGAFYRPSMTINEGATWRLSGEQYFNLSDLALNGGTVVLNNGKDIRIQGGTLAVSATSGGSSFTTESTGFITLYANSTFDVADGTAADDLTVNVQINESGSRSFNKTGAGTMRLNADATHSGSTTIAGGVLALGSGATVVNSTLIQIDAGATLDVSAHGGAYAFSVGQTLSGPGTVAGGVSIDGTIAPGASPGTLSFTDDLVLNNSAILNFELNPADMTPGAGVNDLLAISGSLTLDGLLNMTATSGDFTTAIPGDTWTLATYSGSLTDNGLDLGTMPGLSSGLFWEVSTSTSGRVNLTVIPEPRLALLGPLGMLPLLRRRRIR